MKLILSSPKRRSRDELKEEDPFHKVMSNNGSNSPPTSPKRLKTVTPSKPESRAQVFRPARTCLFDQEKECLLVLQRSSGRELGIKQSEHTSPEPEATVIPALEEKFINIQTENQLTGTGAVLIIDDAESKTTSVDMSDVVQKSCS